MKKENPIFIVGENSSYGMPKGKLVTQDLLQRLFEKKYLKDNRVFFRIRPDAVGHPGYHAVGVVKDEEGNIIRVMGDPFSQGINVPLGEVDFIENPNMFVELVKLEKVV